MSAEEFTEEARGRLVRKTQRWAKVFGILSGLSFASAIASIVVWGDWQDGNRAVDVLIISWVLFAIGAAIEASKADDYRYSLSLPDLDQRIREIDEMSHRARELANTAHSRIAQIERMGQQGRVIIPDTLNVRLTNDGSSG